MLLAIVVIVGFVFQSKVEDGLMKTAGKLLGVTATISYLLTALTSPGLYDPLENVETKTRYIFNYFRYCHKCMHFSPKDVVHCMKCDTCIEGFDHHCPFVSKCVGKGNLLYFYAFMSSLSLFSIYVWYTIYLILMGKVGN